MCMEVIVSFTDRDHTIVLSTIIRRHKRGTSIATLVWRTFYSKLGIDWVDGDQRNTIPDDCVKNWFYKFVRPQDQLFPDSYYIVEALHPVWQEIIEGILKSSKPRRSSVTSG